MATSRVSRPRTTATTRAATTPGATVSAAAETRSTFAFDVARSAAAPAAFGGRTTVDVGEKTIIPTIIRDGKEVKAPAFSIDKVAELVGRLRPTPRIHVPRTVTQSIPPGVRVPRGTPIDLVLVESKDIGFSLFELAHSDLLLKSMSDVQPLIDDPVVGPLLDRRSADDLTADEKTALTTKLSAAGIGVDDAQATKSLSLAFHSLQSARAFR